MSLVEARPEESNKATATSMEPATTAGAPTVAVRRKTIDAVLVGAGALVTVVLVVAGALLTWGSTFASDYVHDELSAQNITFPDEAALREDGRVDLVGYASEQVTTGTQAQAYASYIAHHLDGVADGATYADLGGPERAAQAEVQAAKDAGSPEATVAELQGKADAITGQRNTLFKGETLRGLLLSTFAWSTVGRIAGIAAIVSFVAAAAMGVLVMLGLVHLRKVRRS